MYTCTVGCVLREMLLILPLERAVHIVSLSLLFHDTIDATLCVSENKSLGETKIR